MSRPPLRPPFSAALVTLAALAWLACARPAGAQGLNAACSRNGRDVWVVGDNGLFFHSFTYGTSWTTGNLGARSLRGVAARNFNVVAVGDSGKIWRSANDGGTWALSVIAGAPVLRALQMPTDSVLFAVGAGGRILRSRNGGATWTSLVSGTSATLNAVRFRDARHGWVVGDNAVALHTDDGGDTWLPVAVPTTQRLLAVDVLGAYVWITGSANVALQSFDNGVHWTSPDLDLESRSDMNAVSIQAPNRVILSGGGGFLRVTADSGATWSWMKHPLLGGLHALAFSPDGKHGWACGHNSLAVEATQDSGATWDLTPGTTQGGATWTRTLVFTQTVLAQPRGRSIAINPLAPDVLFSALGGILSRSPDRGSTWIALGNSISDGAYVPGKIHALYVSARDSSRWVVAAANGTANDRILISTDRGATWNTTFNAPFSEYGVPLERSPNHPDTLLFAPEDGHVYRSFDFGATWDTLSNPGFRSPCDIQIVRGDDDNVWVGDGVTGVGQGEVWQSRDGGLTFTRRYPQPADTLTNGSEVPMMASARHDPRFGIATHWPTGGMSATADSGRTWTQLVNTASTWGADIAHDDPTVPVFGVFSGQAGLISTDGGANFNLYTLTGSNYSISALDRSTLLAEQSNGIYKFTPAYSTPVNNSQFITLDSPRGGQTWSPGQTQPILWTATSIAIVRVEVRYTPNGAWNPIADVDGTLGLLNWVVPDTASATVKVRVRDLWDSFPLDSSATNVTIAAPRLAVSRTALDFGARAVGSATSDTLLLRNPGTAIVHVGPLAAAGPGFTIGRTSLALAPGQSDTLGLTFRPALPIHYASTLALTSDAPGAPTAVALGGAGVDTLHLKLTSPIGGEAWQVGSTRWIEWESALIPAVSLDWQSAPGTWSAIADSVPAAAGLYGWSVPPTPGAAARVRVRQRGGGIADSSAAPFSIVAPGFAAAPTILDFGPVTVGTQRFDTLHVANPGNAPLMISWVGSDRPTFQPARTWLTLAPGASDSLGLVFAPNFIGLDSALVVFTGDDLASPHALRVFGTGSLTAPASAEIPTRFALEQNMPNPWGRQTVIRYALPERALVDLELFDLQGQRVATLAHGEQPAGTYAIAVGQGLGDVRALPAGVYFYRLRAGRESATRKMLLMR